jgi:hypothetical protein
LEDEEKMTKAELELRNIGRKDPKRHLSDRTDHLMASNTLQLIGSGLRLMAAQET